MSWNRMLVEDSGEQGDDYYYYDESGERVGGFMNYIPKTTDPGPWIIVFTLVYTLLTVLLIPVLVVWGNRYAEYKKQLQEIRGSRAANRKLFAGEDEEDGDLVDVDLGGKGGGRRRSTTNDTPRTSALSPDANDKFDFDGDDLYASHSKSSPHHHNNHHINNSKYSTPRLHGRHQPRSTIIGTDQKSIISGMGSTLSGVSRFGRHANRPFEGIGVPRVMGGAATTVGFSHSETARSILDVPGTNDYRDQGGGSLVSHRRGFVTAEDGGSSLISIASTASFLDAGATRGGRRGRGRRGCRTSTMEDRSKLMEQEDKAVVKSSESSWIGREKVIADETDLHSSSSMSMNKVRQRMQKQQQHQHHGQLPDLEQAAWSVSPKIRRSSSKSNLKQRGRATAIDDIRPDDAADADDPGKAKEYYEDQDLELTACCGPRALWHRRTLAAGLDHLITIAEPDKEMQRIVRLSVPLTLGEMMECLFDSITVIIISQSMGTDDLTAYVTTALMIGLTDEFIGGVVDAQHTLCSHAYGAGQNFLCGQYIQLGSVMYGIVSIPFLGGWVFAMKPILLFLGMGDSIAQRAADYTRLVVIDYLLEGVAGSLDIILEITGHEVFGTVSDVLEGIVDCVGLIALVMTKKDATLVHVALLHLSVATLFIIVYFFIAYAKGWFRPFWKGMIKNNAFKNKPAVKNIFYTAIPLSIGSFLEYGEWELLTFSVAALGPAEVAVWALLGNVWEIFEASTVGLGDAAEIRTAYHLGKRNPELAKLSSYKSLFLSTIAGVFVTAILFMMGPNLATWFTKDPTLQHMLNDLIPIVGIGNITMTFGMTCWSIVGAQGRYRLATCISMASSWFVTIPLALLFTVGTKIDLQGVVSAVVVGYSTSGMILSYILLTSDWKSISDSIYELNLAAGEMLSDDSDAGSSSSSGSSVSSESDSDDESSVDSDDDSDDDDNASKSIVSKRSVGSKSIVSKRSVGSRSIVSKKSLSNTVSVS